MLARNVTKIDLARKIGERYLEDYSDHVSKLLHSNHDIAKKITELDANLSDRNLQKTLLNYYFQLPNGNGQMAKELRHFFAIHLHNPYLLITHYPLKKINNIGKSYLEKYPEGSFRLFSHTHQNDAIKLKIFQHPHKMDRITPEDVIRMQWIALYDIYRGLAQGELARELEDIFVEVFDVDLNNPEQARVYIDRKVEKAIAALPKDDIQSFTPTLR